MSLVVDGVWPGRITITKGWGRAIARPWNDESDAGHLQLVRGSSDFLAQATGVVAECGDGRVYSPPLYRSATRVWLRAGYAHFDTLLMMERTLSNPWPARRGPVVVATDPDWDAINRVDLAAFHGFWRLGTQGLRESAATTPETVVLTVLEDDELVGFAIVGAQHGLGYLQRIAVTRERQGLGSALLTSALDWAKSRGCRSMLLNVRRETESARRLYSTFGFEDTPTGLDILVHTSPPMLN
jgi:ribosomal-protein-alanine N-acetyltransferase